MDDFLQILRDLDKQNKLSEKLCEAEEKKADASELSSDIEKPCKVGATVLGTITKVQANGFLVNLINPYFGFLPKSRVNQEYIASLRKGTVLEVFVISKSKKGEANFFSLTPADRNIRKIAAQKEVTLGESMACKVSKIDGAQAYFSVSGSNYGVLKKSKVNKELFDSLSVGKKAEVVPVKLTGGNRYELVSTQEYLQEKNRKRHIEAAAIFEQGNVYLAEVTSIEENCVRLDVGGYDGLVWKKDAQWDKSIRLSDIYYVGEELEVVYIHYVSNEDYLSFGIRQVQEKPYEDQLYDLDLDQVLKLLGSPSRNFFAQADVNGKLVNLYSAPEGNFENEGEFLAEPYSGKNIELFASNADAIVSGNFYLVEIERLADKDFRMKRNDIFLFFARVIKQVDNPFKRDVEDEFCKIDNPKMSSSLASTLSEIGKNMYSSKDRMFFELVQNADDAAAKNGVRISVGCVKDYLVLCHNGRSFDHNDFVAITSSANGTKRKSEDKTGYKGIGFKSVFTDAETVYIRSAGYCFKFDKNSELFRDFDVFYKRVVPQNATSETIWEEFAHKYRSERSHFNGVASVPWQMMPFWVEANELPDEISGRFDGSSNVAIALRMGEDKMQGLEGYATTIRHILSVPKFMLFLRHTQRISDTSSDLDLAKKTIGDVVTLTFSMKGKLVERSSYRIKKFLVSVKDEDFAALDFDIHRSNKKVGAENQDEYIFVNSKGVEYENIPTKMAASEAVEIVFAVPIDSDGKLAPNIKCNDVSVFSYLPTDVKDFRFPFYVNANFVLDSPRQHVQSDNPWNQYLMRRIAECLVDWCVELGSECDPQYLNVLVANPFDDSTSDVHSLAENFNDAYRGALNGRHFVLNDKGLLVGLEDVIIDVSGLSQIVDEDSLLHIIGTEKHFVGKQIAKEVLSGEFFENVELLDYVKALRAIKSNNLISEWYLSATDESRSKFLDWLSNRGSDAKSLFSALPFFSFHSGYKSRNVVDSDDSLIIRTAKIGPIADILTALGFECSDNQFEDLPEVASRNIAGQDEDNIFRKVADRIIGCTLSLDMGVRLGEAMDKFDRDRSNNAPPLFKRLPLFSFPSGVRSLSEIESDNSLIIKTSKIEPIVDVLTAVGFECSENQMDELPYAVACHLSKQDESSILSTVSDRVENYNLSAEMCRRLVVALDGFEKSSSDSVSKICIFHNRKGERHSLCEMTKSDKNYLADFSIADDEYDECLDDFLVPTSRVFSDFLTADNLPKIVNESTINEIVSDFQNSLNDSFWQTLRTFIKPEVLIDYLSANASSFVIRSFLDDLPPIDLVEDEYPASSYVSKCFALAQRLGRMSYLLDKTKLDGNTVGKFLISDSVYLDLGSDGSWKCKLSELLPERKSDILRKFNEMFPGIENVHYENKNDNGYLFDEIRGIASNSGYVTPIQFVFSSLFNHIKNWTVYNNYGVGDAAHRFEKDKVELIEFCYKSKTPAEVIKPYLSTSKLKIGIEGKFLPNGNLLLSSELLSEDLIAWAGVDNDKISYLKKLGLRGSDCQMMLVRSAFLSDASTSASIADQCDVSSSLEWLSSYYEKNPYLRNADLSEAREAILTSLLDRYTRYGNYKKCSITDCFNKSEEWEGNGAYADWKSRSQVKVFISPKGIPSRLIYENKSLGIVYENSIKDFGTDIFIDGGRDVQSALLEIAKSGSSSYFKMKDWEALFTASRSEVDALNYKIAELERQLDEAQKREAGVTPFDELGGLDKEKKIEAQREAQKALMEQYPNWSFPEGFAQGGCYSCNSATDERGGKVFFVIKSYKDQNAPLRVNAEECEYLLTKDAILFIYTYDDYDKSKKCRCFPHSVLDLLCKQSSVNISFDSSNLDIEERLIKFCELLRYFKGITFNFNQFEVHRHEMEDVRRMIFAKNNPDAKGTVGTDDDI